MAAHSLGIALAERTSVVSPSPTPGQRRAAAANDTGAHGTSSRWGRKQDSDWGTALGAFGMMTVSRPQRPDEGRPRHDPLVLDCAMAPILVWFFLWSCAEHDCSLLSASQRVAHILMHEDPTALFHLWNFPALINVESVLLWFGWLLLQFLLYSFVPGPIDHGQPTPAGYTLKYVVNGWSCWWLCHLACLSLLYFVGFRSALVVSRNWLSLFWIANVAGWLLAIGAYIKSHLSPTHIHDNKRSGSLVYDLFMGVEHNPRLTSHPLSFDFKLFFNGRPGILAWTLINLSFAVSQYFRFSAVSNSMVILNLLHAIYVLDFFWNEGWYLRTIDICHEHFGYYLSWGDLVWLPFMYTLQGLFLSTHFVQLSSVGCLGVLALGLGGYVLFRKVNDEKDRFRANMKRLEKMHGEQAMAGRGATKTSQQVDSEPTAADAIANGNRNQLRTRDGGASKASESTGAKPCQVVQFKGATVLELPAHPTWFAPTRYLAARYHTGFKNEERQSYLLLSGFWGLSRHMNYLGDLMVSLAFCLTCGFTHILPYFYIVYMVLLLLHRVARDDDKCRQKYGAIWDKYCSASRQHERAPPSRPAGGTRGRSGMGMEERANLNFKGVG